MLPVRLTRALPPRARPERSTAPRVPLRTRPAPQPTPATVDGAVGSATDAVGTAAGALPTDGGLADAAGAVNGNLLNVNVDLAAQADIAAPINGAVAANANVAAPIDAAVAANIGSIDSNAFAVSQQDAIINQNIEGEATATADQQSDLKQ